MAQSSTSGMGSLFAGIIAGWDGVGKIFDDVGIVQREREFKDKAAEQEAKDRAAAGKAAAGSTKLSTALLESGDTGTVTTTQTSQTPYTGAKLAGQLNVEAIPTGAAPAGGPSGTTTAAEPVPKPGGAIPARPVDPYLAQNPQAGPNAPPVAANAWKSGMTNAPPSTPYAGEAAERSTLAAPAAPTTDTGVPPDDTDPGSADYGGGGADKESSRQIPSAAQQPQITQTQAVPTGAGTTIGASPRYAEAMGQSLLGLGATASRRRGLGAPDFAEEQQALTTALPVARRAQRPRPTQQAAIPALLPQVDIFGNPITPPGVRSV